MIVRLILQSYLYSTEIIILKLNDYIKFNIIVLNFNLILNLVLLLVLVADYIHIV